LGDLLGHALGVGHPAAGVDEDELAAVPVRVVGDAVAGHSGYVLDDGLTAPEDAVDERRLADIRASDHRHDGLGQDGFFAHGSPRAFGSAHPICWAACTTLVGSSPRRTSETGARRDHRPPVTMRA